MAAAAVSTLALFLDGLLAGIFLDSCLVEHAMRGLSPADWLAYKQAKGRLFDRVMPAVFQIVLAVTILAAALAFAWARLAAVLLLLVTFAVTMIVHLPLNRRFAGWTAATMPADWSEGRARWRQWNVLRAAFAITAFAAAIAA